MGKKKYLIEKKYLDLEQDVQEIDLINRLIIFDPMSFKEEYRELKYLICKVFDGGGCRPHSFGTGIFVENMYDGEKYKGNKYNVQNVVKKEYETEVIEKYCK